MERVHLNVVGGDGENGLPEKMTCMEDSKFFFYCCRFHLWQGSLWKPILVKWRWNTLTQRFLQVVRNTKSPVSGGETPSPPAEEKETAQKDPQNDGKMALCSLYITFRA